MIYYVIRRSRVETYVLRSELYWNEWIDEVDHLTNLGTALVKNLSSQSIFGSTADVVTSNATLAFRIAFLQASSFPM